MNEIITLKNGLKFVVLSKIDYENEKYLYLCSYDNDLDIIFAKVVDGDKILPIEDENLIIELIKNANKDIK